MHHTYYNKKKNKKYKIKEEQCELNDSGNWDTGNEAKSTHHNISPSPTRTSAAIYNTSTSIQQSFAMLEWQEWSDGVSHIHFGK